MTTRAEFHTRLVVLAEAGHPTPCVATRTSWWVSDLPDDQARAVAECTTCAVLGLCGSFIDANPEPAGVYAARTPIDRNPRKPRQETAA
ncbi:hypothetical protein [Cellulomonas sp. P24]|uniref:hypothetical protein n=1 Tax=Cellulomonas sp. P24 TaxID=2885206 RepID=UPI00216AD7F7|nr:hypothetical protein [Cellulomonas sp. P24]MCR6494237.1 hypothetical protein [Cellulomonas sp. P24]